jgi:hypothetical protein
MPIMGIFLYKKNLSPKVAKEYILEHYGDINGWITTQIESTIYSLKNQIRVNI